MQLFNDTPFVAQSFVQAGMSGMLNAVVVARGSFVVDVERSGHVHRVDDRRDRNWHDVFETTSRGSSLVTPGDMAPFKPQTDVTVIGTAHSDEPRSSWPIALQVGERRKVLRVHGERSWEPLSKGLGRKFAGWRMTEGLATTAVPVTWEKAYGGMRPSASGQPPDFHAGNPVGVGILDEAHSPKDRLIPAPQVEAAEVPITDWRADYAPQGIAPIAAWWGPRHEHSGTFDAAWRERRSPLLPLDFDYQFWQAAPATQRFKPWLFGNEIVRLAGFFATVPDFEFRLPLQKIFCLVKYSDNKISSNIMFLDGVHLELGKAEIRCRLSWRASFPNSTDVLSCLIALLDRKDPCAEERDLAELA